MDSPNASAQLLEAFDEALEEEDAPGGAEVEEPTEDEPETPAEPETEEEPAETEEPEEEPDESETEEGEGDGEQEEETEEAPADPDADPEVTAFLAKYGGDEAQALRAAAQLNHLLGKRDREKEELVARNMQLEAALVEAQTLTGGLGPPLNDAQKAWVEEAAESVNPAGFVRQALEQGEFDLARAVCREWAHSNPYEAGRVGQYVDLTEYQAREAQAAPVNASTDQIIEALSNEVPEMRAYYGQMAALVARFGDQHPLVVESRSADPEEAMRGMFAIYEIARASTATVQETRAQIKERQREEADDVRRKGVVSSAANSPSPTETPRTREIMPGLTLEALDTEFARS
jgi:hypothetical protein